MAIDTLNSVPSEMTAGDTVKLLLSYTDFSASSWTATVAFLGENSQSRFDVEATASGDNYSLTLTPAITQNAFPGTYNFSIYVENTGGERATVDQGTIQIKPNLALATQPQTWAKQALDLVEAALLKRLPKGMESFSINGKSINRMATSELYSIRDRLKTEVQNQIAASGRGRKRNHLVRFTNV